MIRAFVVAAVLAATVEPSLAAGQDIYCETTNLDGSERDLVRRTKGKDLTFNQAKKRWERNSKLTLERFYDNGRYEQISLVPYMEHRKGRCGAFAETKYRKVIEELSKKYN